MIKQIILLSGPICSGKTELCNSLVEDFGFLALKTKNVIRHLFDENKNGRGDMQKFGDKLDRQTDGGWVRDAIFRVAAEHQNNFSTDDGIFEIISGTNERTESEKDVSIVVDAVRIIPQIEAIRRAFGPKVFHIHLTAPLEVLEERYLIRQRKKLKEFASYAEVRVNKTERNIEKLSPVADVVIDTFRCTKVDVVVRAASHLGLYGRESEQLVDVLIGGQYGSEGKGHIASYLAKEYDFLVRVGEPNAGHKVFEEPNPFTFHQLPSGTRSSEAKLIIGPGAIINVEKILWEIAACHIDKSRLSIDPQAMIIEPSDIRKEEQLKKDISSTGQGVGIATSRRIIERGKITRGKYSVRMACDIVNLKPFVRSTYRVLEDAFAARKKIFLEGTQGTGLSLYHGLYPYVTSRDTTVAGCLAEAGISPRRIRKIIMVCRTYPIRVADPGLDGKTSGFMSQPLTWEEIADRAKLDSTEIMEAERTTTTNRNRRVAEFDWELLRKATTLNAPTDIALTFTDYLSKNNQTARRFDQLEDETIRFIQEVERVTSAPISLISTGFNSRSIIDRRKW